MKEHLIAMLEYIYHPDYLKLYYILSKISYAAVQTVLLKIPNDVTLKGKGKEKGKRKPLEGLEEILS